MRPSLLTWLCASLSAGLPRWSLLLSCHSRASGTSGTDSSTAYPWSISRSHSLKLAGSRSATYNLAAARLSARGRAPTKTGLCCESSSGSSVLLMARVLQLHNGVLCNLDLFLKLRHVEEFPGCRHVIWDVSRVELETQIRLVFSLKLHAPRVTERQCLVPKAVS